MAGNDREMISKNFVNIPDTLQQRLLLTTIAKIAKMTRFESSNQKPEMLLLLVGEVVFSQFSDCSPRPL